MSQYEDIEAVESSNDDESDTMEPVVKRAKKTKDRKKKNNAKKSRRHLSSDEDEDEIDEDKLDEELKEELKGKSMKRYIKFQEIFCKSESLSDDGELSDDDLDLVKDNLGLKVGGRVQISDDEDDRERIKSDLFGQDNFDEHEEQIDRDIYDDEAQSDGESDQSEDDFIAPLDGRIKQRGRKSALNKELVGDAREIFGIDEVNEWYDNEDDDFQVEEMYDQPRRKQRTKKISLLNAVEPSELDKCFINSIDKKIIFEDIPERHQMRKMPVTATDEDSLKSEAMWIQKYAFQMDLLSRQETVDLGNDNAAILEKIQTTLEYIKNHQFEVPFIAFYRKEDIEPTLNIRDLWRIYQYDEKWCRLELRKSRLLNLFKRVQAYADVSAENLRQVSERDLNDVVNIQTCDELSDLNDLFQLYYSNEIHRMPQLENFDEDRNIEPDVSLKIKQRGRSDKYQLCVQNGLQPLADKFGLTPDEFAENFAGYTKTEVRQCEEEPLDAAKKYVNITFLTPETVIKGASYILAKQFSREPSVRRKLREFFRRHLKMSACPTKKGQEIFDYKHPLFGRHYIKDKPVSRLKDEEYLQYVKAKNDSLMDIKLHAQTEDEENSMLNFLMNESQFQRNENSAVAEKWNKCRRDVLQICVDELLIPTFAREAHEILLDEAKEFVVKHCSSKLAENISMGIYQPSFRYTNEDNEIEGNGVRIMAICYSMGNHVAAFACVIDENGTVLGHQRLNDVTSRSRIHFESRKASLQNLRKFILEHRVHVITICGENFEAFRLAGDVRGLVQSMYNDRDLENEIPVEITDNNAAKVYANSRMATEEFREYPPLLKQSVSLARYCLEPLVEVSRLFNADNDVLFINLHSIQSEIPKDDLFIALLHECINRVNEVGVDINRCLEFPHVANLLQFVCGLGPRKASYLLNLISREGNSFLESRTKLVSSFNMTKTIFMNAAGFIKLDTPKISERSDYYAEPLDGTRIHPETYDWARKMVIDALDLDDDADPAEAMEEIVRCPEKLSDLDLDAFAEEIEKQVSIFNSRAELCQHYSDVRPPHRSPEEKELFKMLVHDSELYIEGKLVSGTILYIAYRPPNEKDSAKVFNPIYNNAKGSWACMFCFQEYGDCNEVQEHRSRCRGIPLGAKVRLENEMLGFVNLRNISERMGPLGDPTKILIPGSCHLFRVLSVDFNKMQCELSCKSSDLQGANVDVRDEYFAESQYQRDKEQKIKAKRVRNMQTCFVKRLIRHPNFHNVTFAQAEVMLKDMPVGDVVVRPSSKSVNNLTVTWKVAHDIYQHISVQESDKPNQFSIGRVLSINDEPFEDLDEILARYIQPLTGYAHDITSYKYFMAGVTSEDREIIAKHLSDEKQRCPSKIPYTLTASAKFAGFFAISYLIQSKTQHEYFSITPNGITFRYQEFQTTDDLINWFKVNFSRNPNAVME
ncbi:SH2 domain-containing protein [Ditylenchus destructor]|uniref:Suppressor of Ty 6 homolog n=1 Tax=Ditylenchus destructor TaxID=166010 RepID=A0AAD4R6K5_9BILA|nr:SH2 domain-containing protein [Ditylenchus destructor]